MMIGLRRWIRITRMVPHATCLNSLSNPVRVMKRMKLMKQMGVEAFVLTDTNNMVTIGTVTKKLWQW